MEPYPPGSYQPRGPHLYPPQVPHPPFPYTHPPFNPRQGLPPPPHFQQYGNFQHPPGQFGAQYGYPQAPPPAAYFGFPHAPPPRFSGSRPRFFHQKRPRDTDDRGQRQRGRPHHFRGKIGAVGGPQRTPSSDYDPYYDRSMFEDPWRDLLPPPQTQSATSPAESRSEQLPDKDTACTALDSKASTDLVAEPSLQKDTTTETHAHKDDTLSVGKSTEN